MRRHLCVILPSEAAEPIEQLRRRWDPVMAAVVPAHLTVTYPEETPNEPLLLERAETIAGKTPPFRLRVGTPFTAESGVFLSIEDVEAGWQTLKQRLLTPPMTPVDFPPHVTVAHPRTSPHADECAQALADLRLTVEFEARELAYTETTADTFTVLRRFALTAPSKSQSAERSR